MLFSIKKLLLFSILFYIIVPIYGQKCDADSAVIAKYRYSAYKLAYKELHKPNSVYKDSVIIPENVYNQKIKSLMAVYNSVSKERDTVIDLLKIKNYYAPKAFAYLNYISLTIDPSEKWAQAFKKNEIKTGHKVIDSLTTLYQFTLYGVDSLRDGRLYVALESSLFLNVDLLTPLFQKVKGVKVGFYGPVGDGDYITDTLKSSTTLVCYSYGMGDCPAGCTARRFWIFEVDSACNVSFIRSYGDKYEPRESLGFSNTIIQQSLSIYPNPAIDRVTIAFPNSNSTTIIMTYDLAGRLVLQEQTDKIGNYDLNIASLAPGNYMIVVQNKDGVYRSMINKN